MEQLNQVFVNNSMYSDFYAKYCQIEPEQATQIQESQLGFVLMYRSNRSFNIPPRGNPPGHLTFFKIIVQIPPYLSQNAPQMPHTRVYSDDQMPPPRGQNSRA